jgi:hypothetical protein
MRPFATLQLLFDVMSERFHALRHDPGKSTALMSIPTGTSQQMIYF